ncbi:MAG: DUF1015 domain-containing protein [Candidatus Zixiibacteriota bacterium]
MAIAKPFCGLRPKPDLASVVVSPPYDVLSSEEARRMVQDNPDSFLRVNKPEVDFPDTTSLYSNKVYERGRKNLLHLIDDGKLTRDLTPCLYLYRLSIGDRQQTGLAALTSVDEYEKGLIKKHEHTRPEKVSDRADHIMTLKAQVGPVFSIFRHSAEVAGLFDQLTSAEPEVDFVADDKVRHRLWVISQSESVARIQSAFSRIPELYIADGHHRSEAAAEVRRRVRAEGPDSAPQPPYDFFLNVIFPDDEVCILPYNRVVSGMDSMPPDALLEKLRGSFDLSPVDEAVVPDRPYVVGMYYQRQWYRLPFKNETVNRDHPVESIDSAVLTYAVLDPILGITDIRADKRIGFVGGSRGVAELERLVNSGAFELAFSLYPATVEQLLQVADAGDVMPPKSTWFEPKLRSGMIVNLLDTQ